LPEIPFHLGQFVDSINPKTEAVIYPHQRIADTSWAHGRPTRNTFEQRHVYDMGRAGLRPKDQRSWGPLNIRPTSNLSILPAVPAPHPTPLRRDVLLASTGTDSRTTSSSKRAGVSSWSCLGQLQCRKPLSWILSRYSKG
jgi:hypothetical protein